jgi:hypothetical protein
VNNVTEPIYLFICLFCEEVNLLAIKLQR